MMKSKYWIYGILLLTVIGIIFISGCTPSKEYVCPDGTIVSSASLCSNTQEGWSSEPEQPTYSDCNKFLSKEEKRSCKREVAVAIGDMSYCPTAYKDDPSYDLPDNIDNCLNDVHLSNWRKGKITFSDCEYFNYPANENKCKMDLIILKKEPLLCDTLYGGYKDQCYLEVAREMEDKSVCNNIEDTEYKYECIDEITKYS